MNENTIDNILSKSPSKAEATEYIFNRYKNKVSLDLFLDEFFSETKSRYLDILFKLTDNDILCFLDFQNEHKEAFEIPLITITHSEYEKVKYFIRNVNGYKFISNCYGIGQQQNADFMRVIQLDHFVLEHFGIVNLSYHLSVSIELEQIVFLFSILENFGLFFKDKTTSTPPEKPQHPTGSLSENNFDHVDINKVYDYFYKELVKTTFLSDKQLKEYLKVAFEQPQAPKKKFTFQNDPLKSKMNNVFYRYYTEVAGRGHRKKYRKDCAELLGEYFTGYTTKKVLDNFNK